MPTAEQRLHDMVRNGATIEVIFEDRVVQGPFPLVAYRYVDSTFGFFWLGTEREHAVAAERIVDGDDEDVLVIASGPDEGLTGRVWRIWEQPHLDQLAAYVKSVKDGSEPKIGLGPDWTRYAQLD